jgi:hypothetical protein
LAPKSGRSSNCFYWITPLGQIKEGADGFIYVCDFHNIFEVTGYPTVNAEFAVDHAELVVHKGGVYALKASSAGLADSFWPRFRKK